MFDSDVKTAEQTSPDGFGELDDEALSAEVASLAAQLAAGEARLVELAAEVDRRGLWGGKWEARSLAEWLSWLTGMSPRAAREHAQVAALLEELPTTHAALAEGSIQLRPGPPDRLDSGARARGQACQSCPADDHGSAPAGGAGLPQGHRPGRDQRRQPGARAPLSGLLLPGGLLRAAREAHHRGHGALVAKALDRAKDKLFRSPPGDASVPAESKPEWDSPGGLRADALRDLAEDWLGDHKGTGRANSYEVVVHLEAEALRDDASGARCEIEGAGAIAPETARRLTCDSALVGLVESDGEPLSIGRRSRRVPHGLRRALEARDRSCRFPGCANLARLDAHHVAHWTKDKGPTELPNLALLCKRHHRMVHEGGYTMARARDGTWTFTTPAGYEVKLPERQRSSSEELTRNRSKGREPEREPYAPEGAGEGIDLDYVTGAVLFQ
ncbi:HNH endonuclease signature motif containing protein [soil metagenome]